MRTFLWAGGYKFCIRQVSECVETPTQEARAHDPHAHGGRKDGREKYTETASSPSSARNDSAGGTVVLVSGRQLCPGVPVPREARTDEMKQETHVTVDLLRKSGLLWLGLRREPLVCAPKQTPADKLGWLAARRG